MYALNGKKERKLGVPHTYALLFAMIVICAVLTWIVPAGTYDTMVHEPTGRAVIDPATFHYVDRTPVGLFDVFSAIHTGMVNNASVIFFIFVVGGGFTIIQDTGVMDAAIGKLALMLQNHVNFLIIIILFTFSVLGGTMGMAEEIIIFIPLVISLCKKLKMDSMVALALTMVGARVGFTTGLLNPFTVGVAQGLSELPLYSGLGYRLIWYAVILVMTCAYVLRYKTKIINDTTKSVMHGIYDFTEADVNIVTEFTKRYAFILIEMLICFAIMFYGVFVHGWFMKEQAALFLIMGVLAGLIGGMSVNQICKSFAAGTKDMTFAALVCGIASGILVVLESGQIIHTIIHTIAIAVVDMPAIVAANCMYISHLFINFLIPSGSGKAAATIPIMIPLADLLGISRQTVVLAFHYGDGFTKLVAPTVGTLMASLGIAKVPFYRYLKWIAPLVIGWILVGFVSVSIATVISLGPF